MIGRQSHYKARESVFTAGVDLREGQEVCPPSLEECVAALEDCCEQLQETQELMRHGTHDYPRMKRLLDNERLFLLINESKVNRYKAQVADEVEPCINELLDKAERGKKSFEKQESSLQTKVAAAQAKTKVPTYNPSNPESKRLQQLTKTRKQLEAELQTLAADVEQLENNTRR